MWAAAVVTACLGVVFAATLWDRALRPAAGWLVGAGRRGWRWLWRRWS